MTSGVVAVLLGGVVAVLLGGVVAGFQNKKNGYNFF